MQADHKDWQEKVQTIEDLKQERKNLEQQLDILREQVEPTKAWKSKVVAARKHRIAIKAQICDLESDLPEEPNAIAAVGLLQCVSSI